MKCPLDFPVRAKTVDGVELRGGDCLKANCAWWDGTTERCAILELTVQLRSVNANIVRMSQGMTLR